MNDLAMCVVCAVALYWTKRLWRRAVLGYASATVAPIQWMRSGLKVSAFSFLARTTRSQWIFIHAGKFAWKTKQMMYFGDRVIDGGVRMVAICGL